MNKATWILLGAAAALAAGAPASAQSVSGGFGRHVGAPGHGLPGHHRIGRHRDHCARLGLDCRGRGFRVGDGLLGWGGGLLEDPEYAARDAGFFSGPAEVLTANGGAYYDYDRSYPYDWYSEPGERAGETPVAAAPVVRCDVAWVPGRGGERSPVRICRGR